MIFSLPAHWFAGSSPDDNAGAYGRGADPRPHPGDTGMVFPDAIDRRLGVPVADIVRGIRAGDERLFGRLFDAYWGPLARFASLYTRNDDEAEDVAAQVFAALWHGRTTWAPHRGVELYLYGAVRNRARNAHRAAGRAERQLAALTADGRSPTAGEAVLRADEAVVADERRAILLRAVNSLVGRTREVLLLRWLRGLEFDEIAALLGMSRNAVYVSYHRAIAQLRERLPGYFG